QREGAEEQLRQSQRLESLGRLAGGVAHDFNNLLTVILGNLALVRGELPDDSTAAEDIGMAERAARRASELTRKLLTFARRQSVAPQVLELQQQLRDLEAIFKRLVGEDVRLVGDHAPGLWPVLMDPGHLEQVVTNLVVNARDAMPDGGTITLRTRNVTFSGDRPNPGGLPPGEYVQLEVTDSGTGMGPDVLARIFEPFFTTKEPGKGTGLGLATVYGIVHQAGGHVDVRSTPGLGSTFIVLLPRAADGTRAPRDPGATPLPGFGRGERVLLVEDEDAVRQVAVRALSDRGYRVVAAESAESALRRLDDGTPIDLLVTDVVMPGMGGKALAERLLARWPELPVLFVSGYTAEERLEGLLAREGVQLLAKPFTPDHLAFAVRGLLDRPAMGAAAPFPPPGTDG
ncbi:MAG TPA: ATP-binding protein, partial [Gemmatimonadales bacterium]|nr:ATP-binding protein [Gemmatimonadales bacterium]